MPQKYRVNETFVDEVENRFENALKRAYNLVKALEDTKYLICKTGGLLSLYRKRYYEVNAFGEASNYYGNDDHIPEYLLQMGKVDTVDYQLLKFYDVSDGIKAVIYDVRHRAVNGISEISYDEYMLLQAAATFEEDPNLTYEQIMKDFEEELAEEIDRG